MKPRNAQIVWETPEYGVFDASIDANDELPTSTRFGVGANPFEIPTNPPPPPPPPPHDCECKDNSTKVYLYEDALDTDTPTSATLEEWVDLPGLERTLAVDRASVAYVTSHVVIRCSDESDVALAECRLRILVNGEETSGHSIVSFTGAYMKLAGKNVESVRTVPIQCAFPLKKNKEYTYKVQISNWIAATVYTAIVGTTVTAHSNMFLMLFKGVQENDDHNVPPVIPPNPAAEDHNWVRILAVETDGDDSLYAFRVRGEFDTATPSATGTPDRAYIEVIKVGTQSLLTFPLTSVLNWYSSDDLANSGFSILWKKTIDVAFWADYWALLFAINNDGYFAVCYSRDKAGGTAYSQEYELLHLTNGGAQLHYEAWDGPNWLEAAANNNGAKYGSATHDTETTSGFYVVIPTTDTTDKSAATPFKNGWRLARLGAAGLSASYDIPADPGGAGTRWQMPITVDRDYFFYVQLIGVTQTIYAQELTGLSGGSPPPGSAAVCTMGGIRPPTGQALKIKQFTIGGGPGPFDGINASYWMIQGGYGAVLTFQDGDGAVETWNDEYYQVDPAWDHVLLPVFDRNTTTGAGTPAMFMRDAEGGAHDDDWFNETVFNQ